MNILLLFFQDGGGTSVIWTFLPFIAIFAIFYFLVIAPQKKQQQAVKDMVAELKNGDEVVTNGGIVGKIIEVRDTSFIIRSADKSNLEIARTAVVGKRGEEALAKK